jgi:DNA/RNA-binding domain of Phe-tRNA-synthetase-like protein
MQRPVTIELQIPGVALGWVVAEGCEVAASSGELLAKAQAAAALATEEKDSERGAARRARVRDLLRHGVYKPTGRGKPASEYLLNAAAAGAFPLVNALVDINNLVSVESLLPISLVDLDRAGTSSFFCRHGREGESYLFNASGQTLDLRDLLLLARAPGDLPCATPVKDSHATKTHDGTAGVLGVVYAPLSLAGEAGASAARMGELMARFCGAAVTSGLLMSEVKGAEGDGL